MKFKLILIILFFILILSGILTRDPNSSEIAMIKSSIRNIKLDFFTGMHPPLYFIIMFFFRKISNSLVFLRILSIIFSLFSLYIFILISKKLKIKYDVWILLIFMPLFIFFSREVGYYIFHFLIAELVYLSFLYVLSDKKKHIYFFLSQLLAIYSYYYHIFFIAGLWTYLIFFKRRFKDIKWVLLLILFYIPVIMIIIQNPYINGMVLKKSNHLIASKPPVYMFEAKRVFEYKISFPFYLLFSQERYLKYSFGFSIFLSAVLILWAFLDFKEKLFLIVPFLMPFILLLIFDVITVKTINRYSFFPHHLFPYSFLFLFMLLKNRMSYKWNNIFMMLLVGMMFLYDVDLVFNRDFPFHNKDELARLLDIIKKDYDAEFDIIFANCSYEWYRVTLKDVLEFLDDSMKYISLEDFDRFGIKIFKGKKRVFEIKYRFYNLIKNDSKFNDEYPYKRYFLIKKAHEFLFDNFNLKGCIKVYGSSGSHYELFIFEKG